MANRTNKQNRTFSRTCSVCLSSVPHRTEPNNTLVRFVFSAGFRTLIQVFGSVRLELEPNSTLVQFVFGKFELLKAKPSTLYSLASELWIAGVIPGLGSQNNGRGTMAEEQWSEEQWRHWGPQIQRNRNYQEFRGFRLRARSRKPPTFS